MSLEFQNQRRHLQKVEFQKTLKLDSNVFVPSATPIGGEKQADPQLVSASKIQLPSTPADSPSVSVLMKFSKMVLDKSSGNHSEWPERSGQLLAPVDEDGLCEDFGYWWSKNSIREHGFFWSDVSYGLINFET